MKKIIFYRKLVFATVLLLCIQTSNVKADNIIPTLSLTSKNSTSGTSGWAFTKMNYWKMIQGAVLESPAMNFSNYSSIQLSLSLQSFGSSANNANDVKVEYWNGATWTQVGSILHTTGTLGTQTVQLPYTFSGAKIKITVPNATAKAGARVYSVSITGVDINSIHSIVSTFNIAEFSYYYNHGPSTEKTLTVSGTNLIDNVTLTSPADFEISTSSGSAFLPKNSIILTQNGGVLANTTIYIRLKSNLPYAFYDANLSIVSSGATSKYVALSGNVNYFPSNLNFDITTLNKTLEEPAFTKTATSLNLATPITYSSSDNQIATVNNLTGEVNLIAEGSTTITAVQPAGIFNTEWYETDTVSYLLNVGPLPTLAVSETSVPSMTANAGFTTSQAIHVTGTNLYDPNGISLAISGTDKDLFTLSQATISQSGGNVPNTVITISYNPIFQGFHSANLTVSSLGALSLTRLLTGTATDVSTANIQQALNPVATASQGTVHLFASAGELVRVYDATGRKIIQKVAVEGINIIQISTKGLIFVDVAGHVSKLIL